MRVRFPQNYIKQLLMRMNAVGAIHQAKQKHDQRNFTNNQTRVHLRIVTNIICGKWDDFSLEMEEREVKSPAAYDGAS